MVRQRLARSHGREVKTERQLCRRLPGKVHRAGTGQRSQRTEVHGREVPRARNGRKTVREDQVISKFIRERIIRRIHNRRGHAQRPGQGRSERLGAVPGRADRRVDLGPEGLVEVQQAADCPVVDHRNGRAEDARVPDPAKLRGQLVQHGRHVAGADQPEVIQLPKTHKTVRRRGIGEQVGVGDRDRRVGRERPQHRVNRKRSVHRTGRRGHQKRLQAGALKLAERHFPAGVGVYEGNVDLGIQVGRAILDLGVHKARHHVEIQVGAVVDVGGD